MTTITYTPSTLAGGTAHQEVARRDITKILRMIRPYYRSMGGGVELVDIRSGEVVIRLTGTSARGTTGFEEHSSVIDRIVRSRLPNVHTTTVV